MFRKTYDTLLKVFSKTEGLDLFLVGGISAAIQTNKDLYRQNADIDIMCKDEHLPALIEVLEKTGYTVDDRRGIKTRNNVAIDGQFTARDHELNADMKNKKLLGVGIFVYSEQGDEVLTHSYAYEEKEGRVVGMERVIPKELFELMHEDNAVDYKGVKLKSQSKEYIYLRKRAGKREKDKVDADIIEPTLDDKSREKILRIKELESKTKLYRLMYDKDGNVESREKVPSEEDKINSYLDSLYMKSSSKTPEQIVDDVLHSEEYARIINERPQIDSLIKGWSEKAKKQKDAMEFVEKKIKDGSVKNINHETGINDRDLSGHDR